MVRLKSTMGNPLWYARVLGCADLAFIVRRKEMESEA